MSIKKPIKHVVAIVLLNEKKETLFALRAKYDYANTWSLPSYFTKPNEEFKNTVKRIGTSKLGCQIKKIKLLREGKFEKDKYILYMHVYLAKLISGIPKVNTPKYKKIKWAQANSQFKTMKIFGGCTTLYREYLKTHKIT